MTTTTQSSARQHPPCGAYAAELAAWPEIAQALYYECDRLLERQIELERQVERLTASLEEVKGYNANLTGDLATLWNRMNHREAQIQALWEAHITPKVVGKQLARLVMSRLRLKPPPPPSPPPA